jgi:hypothetical protein
VSDERYIWVSRWDEFQHYEHESHRAPAWIKQYTRRLDDDRYLDLKPGERALLHDLRAEFARARSELRADPKRLSRRLGTTVYQRQLETLNQAGFIELLSRPALEHRLERLYSRPRAEVEEEVEKEEEPKAVPVPRPPARTPANGTASEPETVKPLIDASLEGAIHCERALTPSKRRSAECMDVTNVQGHITNLLNALSPEQLARTTAPRRENADAYVLFSARPTAPDDETPATADDVDRAAANGFRIPVRTNDLGVVPTGGQDTGRHP